MQGKEIQNKKAAAKTSSIYLHKKTKPTFAISVLKSENYVVLSFFDFQLF